MIFSLVMTASQGMGQSNLLDLKVHLSLHHLTYPEMLTSIENRYGVLFSYNADILPGGHADLVVQGVTLEKALTVAFGPGYYFKGTGTHIIILKRRPAVPPESPKTIAFTGAVRDARSKGSVALATVYDMSSLQSCLTDQAGGFRLETKPKTTQIALRISKQGYEEKVLLLYADRDSLLSIELIPGEDVLQLLPLRTAAEILATNQLNPVLMQGLLSRQIQLNSLNVQVFDKRPAQISVWPNIGTNLRLGGAIVNRFSVNLVVGYAAGMTGFEIGGLMNMNRLMVSGVQVAGLANLTGNTVTGFQAAGVVNRTGGKTRGCQFAGMYNLANDSVKGMQLAGLANRANKRIHGLQLAGIYNYTQEPSPVFQISGVFNKAPSARFQFGVINVADSADGLPFGLVNVIRGGYYPAGLSLDELGFATVYAGSGSRRLYSMGGITYRLAGPDKAYGFSIGFGTRLIHKKHWDLNLELTSILISAYGGFDQRTMSRLMLTPQICVKTFPGWCLILGPVAQTFISDALHPDVDAFLDNILPSHALHYAPSQTRFDAWAGIMAGWRYNFPNRP